MPKRTSVYLSDEDIKAFEHIKEVTGLPVSIAVRILATLYSAGEIQHAKLPAIASATPVAPTEASDATA